MDAHKSSFVSAALNRVADMILDLSVSVFSAFAPTSASVILILQTEHKRVVSLILQAGGVTLLHKLSIRFFFFNLLRLLDTFNPRKERQEQRERIKEVCRCGYLGSVSSLFFFYMRDDTGRILALNC